MRRENGDLFRRKLLSVGGSIDAMTAFRSVRGRDPDIEPLLRRRGLVAAPGRPAVAPCRHGRARGITAAGAGHGPRNPFLAVPPGLRAEGGAARAARRRPGACPAEPVQPDR